MDLCTYDDILDTIWITDRKLLHFKYSKSGQILRVDKTSFPRLGHKYFAQASNLKIYNISVFIEQFARLIIGYNEQQLLLYL